MNNIIFTTLKNSEKGLEANLLFLATFWKFWFCELQAYDLTHRRV